MYEYKAIIRSVYDGDSVRADIDLGFGVWKTNEKIRFAGLDTPEIRGEERPEGLIARDRLRDLILDKEVVLVTEKDAQGKYGRYIAWIHVEDTEGNSFCVNVLLLEEGLAKPYGD